MLAAVRADGRIAVRDRSTGIVATRPGIPGLRGGGSNAAKGCGGKAEKECPLQ
jgi:hypothetical protein